MTKAEFEIARGFARDLVALRTQLSDAVLLDRCQTYLNQLVKEVEAEFDEHPHLDLDEPMPVNTGYLVEREPELPEPPPLAEASPLRDEPPSKVTHIKKKSHHKKTR